MTPVQELLSETATLLVQTEGLLYRSQSERERTTQLLLLLRENQRQLEQYFQRVYVLEQSTSALLPDMMVT